MKTNHTVRSEEPKKDYQRLRLDMWDMPGSASSCDITHQVRIPPSTLPFFSLSIMQIFLSSRAIYLLVFDLTKDLDQPADWNSVSRPAQQQTLDLLLVASGIDQSRSFELHDALGLLLLGKHPSRTELR